MEAGIKELDKSVEEGTKTCKAENAEYSEEDLARNGRHALVAYIMKPKAGYGYLTTAAHRRRGAPHWRRRERLHHGRLHKLRGCARLLHRPRGGRDEYRVPEPALRQERHRRARHVVLFPAARCRQQPEHGRCGKIMASKSPYPPEVRDYFNSELKQRIFFLNGCVASASSP